MKRRFLMALAPRFGVVILVSISAAHDLFIKMDSYFLPAEASVEIPILNGTFELSENSITVDRVDDISLVHGGDRRKLGTETWVAEGDTTFFGLRTGSPGTYLLGVSTLPRELGMEGVDFNEYLAHDGIPDVLMERALDRELDTEAWERYSKHIKAVFQVGDVQSEGLDVVLGYPAEIIPLTNPYTHSVGSELAFRALVEGKPVSNQLVLAGGAGAMGPIEKRSVRTDDRGVVRFRISEPGRWFIQFINMEKTDAEGIDYESKWATLTFEIR
jgi:hypothetical protein